MDQQDAFAWLSRVPDWIAAPLGALLTWLLIRLRKRFTFVTHVDFDSYKTSRKERDVEVDDKLEEINGNTTRIHQRIDQLYRDLMRGDRNDD